MGPGSKFTTSSHLSLRAGAGGRGRELALPRAVLRNALFLPYTLAKLNNPFNGNFIHSTLKQEKSLPQCNHGNIGPPVSELSRALIPSLILSDFRPRQALHRNALSCNQMGREVLEGLRVSQSQQSPLSRKISKRIIAHPVTSKVRVGPSHRPFYFLLLQTISIYRRRHSTALSVISSLT